MGQIKPIKVFREPPGRPKSTDDELALQLNLGPKSAAWLRAAGINSPAQVRKLGVIETCRRVRAAGFSVSLLLAYALEGALAGCHWNAIAAETKQRLRRELAASKPSAIGRRRASQRI